MGYLVYDRTTYGPTQIVDGLKERDSWIRS